MQRLQALGDGETLLIDVNGYIERKKITRTTDDQDFFQALAMISFVVRRCKGSNQNIIKTGSKVFQAKKKRCLCAE